MKKILSILMIIILSISASGCSVLSGKGADSPEELVENYLAAVADEDYEAIWDMLPKQIQNYALKNRMIINKEQGLNYIAYAVNDYYWLRQMNLPYRDDYKLDIEEINELDIDEGKEYLDSVGLNILITEAVSVYFTVEVDDYYEYDADIYAIKSGGKWYLLSVAGDDEVFVY